MANRKRGPKNYAPEKIIGLLRKVEESLGQGKTVEESVRLIEVSVQTYYRWKKQYAGMQPEDARRLKTLESENKRLKKIVAELSLDKDILKEIIEGKY
jgi:transposase-like protein